MWMSAGGMIGGISAGLIAPHVFSWVAEYPILIVLAILCRPGSALWKRAHEALFWLAALALAILVAVPYLFFGHTFDPTSYWIAVSALLVIAFLLQQFAWKFAALSR
jgi:hypothetical protein